MTLDSMLALAQREFDGLAARCQSVVLATVDEAGRPVASCAPFVLDDAGRVHGFVSRRVATSLGLEVACCASVLFVEHQGASAEVFTREQLTYECDAVVLERDHPDFAELVRRFAVHCAAMGQQNAFMEDHLPLRLTLRSGPFAIGSGAASVVDEQQPGQVPAEAGLRIIDHLNIEHEDVLLLFARALAGVADARRACLEGVDLEGLDLTVRRWDGSTVSIRVAYGEVLFTASEIQTVLRVMVQEAQARERLQRGAP